MPIISMHFYILKISTYLATLVKLKGKYKTMESIGSFQEEMVRLSRNSGLIRSMPNKEVRGIPTNLCKNSAYSNDITFQDSKEVCEGLNSTPTDLLTKI
jgi:hypothetical protein